LRLQALATGLATLSDVGVRQLVGIHA
jgi:hypothetical protein